MWPHQRVAMVTHKDGCGSKCCQCPQLGAEGWRRKLTTGDNYEAKRNTALMMVNTDKSDQETRLTFSTEEIRILCEIPWMIFLLWLKLDNINRPIGAAAVFIRSAQRVDAKTGVFIVKISLYKMRNKGRLNNHSAALTSDYWPLMSSYTNTCKCIR